MPRRPHIVAEVLEALPSFALTGALTLVAPVLASAQQDFPTPGQRYVLTQVSDELSSCSVYYTSVSRCFGGAENRDSPENLKLSQQASDKASALMHVATNLSAMAGRSTAAMSAMVDLEVKGMAKEMGEDCVNLPAVVVKRSDRCKWIAEHGAEYLEKLFRENP